MKYLSKGFLFLTLVGTVIVGCEKEENEIATANKEANSVSTTNKTKINQNKSGFQIGVILENESWNHNLHLANILDEVKVRGCNIHIDTLNAIYQNEVNSLISGDVSNDNLLGDASDFKVINYYLSRKIYHNESPTLTHLPTNLQNQINDIYNSLPSYMKSELKSTYDDMHSGAINETNYTAEFQSRYNNLSALVNSQDEQYMIEAYLKTATQSFEFWLPSELGGLDGINKYSECLDYDGIDDYGDPEMNDNDWPNGVPFPEEVGLDALGAAVSCCNPWRMIGGAILGSV